MNQRFPVFFSEKRPFFMEGMGLFNIAGTGGDSTMRTAVHTRKIIDPSAGLKLTGAQGRHTFGVLSSADAAPPGERQRAFTVGREVMNFGRGQYAGLLVSDTDTATTAIESWAETSRSAGRALSAQRVLPVLQLAHAGRSVEPGPRTQASTTTAPSASPLPARPEHYDTGFRMDGVHQPRRCYAR